MAPALANQATFAPYASGTAASVGIKTAAAPLASTSSLALSAATATTAKALSSETTGQQVQDASDVKGMSSTKTTDMKSEIMRVARLTKFNNASKQSMQKRK